MFGVGLYIVSEIIEFIQSADQIYFSSWGAAVDPIPFQVFLSRFYR